MARLPRLRLALLILASLVLIPLESLRATSAADSPFIFDRPVFVTSSSLYQAAEPSIRVDTSDPNKRIWITAPTSVGVDRRGLPPPGSSPRGGDLFWYSDDDGKTWTVKSSPGPTIVGGGDSDVATGTAGQVYGTGLTLANITLAGSCDNGQTFTTNPISNVGTVEDRQWIDMYEDRAKPATATAPDFLLNYGGIAERRIWFHQVFAPCAPGAPAPPPPVAGPRIDTSTLECIGALSVDRQCYQWPGNLAVDENTGDVYVTHNTLGTPDDVIVTRIDDGADRPVTQADVHPVVAANERPDTFDSFTVVAVDSASNVYVVWNERTGAPRNATDTMLAVSKDRGATWSAPIRVNRLPETHTTVFPWIAAGGPGRISIVYYGTSAPGGFPTPTNPNPVASPETVGPNALWRVWMAKSLNATAATPTFAEGPATGFMHQGNICTSGTGCAAGTRDLLDFFQLDLDEKGLANITYTDNLNTPPDNTVTPPDPHQEWITFVQECRKTSRRMSILCP